MDGLLNMSRGINTSNRKLFDKLLSHGNLPLDGVKRYININNDDFFLHSRLICHITPIIGTQFAIFQHRECSFFCVVGHIGSQFNNADLVEITCNEGKYMAILNELDLKVNRNISQEDIQENILIDYGVEYSGHDFESIKRFFPQISVYKHNSISNLEKEQSVLLLHQLAIDFFCSNEEVTLLPFDKDCVQRYLELSVDKGDYVPIENILRSINASTWRYCFLDLYRCIENLYEIGRTLEYQEFFENIPIEALHTNLQNRYKGYKPTEDTSIKALCSKLEEAHKAILEGCKESKDQAEYKYIYGLRNCIVHHRKDTGISIDYSDSKWNEIIKFMLSIIDFLYHKYKNILPE